MATSHTIAGVPAVEHSVAETFGIAAPPQAVVYGLPPDHPWSHLVPERRKYAFPLDALSRFLTWMGSVLSDDTFAQIWGPTGSGKSEFVKQVHALLNLPLIVVDISEETEVRDLLGGMQLRDGNTVPVPGPFAIAAANGFGVLAEEMDRMDPRKTVGLNGVLRGGPVRLVDDPDNVYRRVPGFRIVATTNTNMARDDFGNYVGGKHDVSTVDGRFPLYLGYLEESVEVPMVLESVPTASRNDPGFQAFVPKAVRLANAIRQRFENGDCQFTLSTRTVLRWAAGVLMFEGSARRTHMSAALYSLNATFADGLDAEDRTILFEAYQLVFGENASQFARAIAKLGRNQYNAASRAGGGMPEDP